MGIARIIIPAVLLLLTLSVLPAQAGSIVLTKDDSGREITVSRGKSIKVQLGFAAGTGYSWQIVDLDQARLKLLESETKPAEDSRRLGGPMVAKYRLKAVSAGQTELKILLYRTWEGKEKAAETFAVRINIK